MVTLSAVIHREPDLYVAECPELGTVTRGRTIEEALANLKEATGLYLEEQEEPRTVAPAILTTFSIDTANAEAVQDFRHASHWRIGTSGLCPRPLARQPCGDDGQIEFLSPDRGSLQASMPFKQGNWHSIN